MAAKPEAIRSAVGWVAVASVGVASAAAGLSGEFPDGPWVPSAWWTCYAVYVVFFWLADAPPPWTGWVPPAAAVVALTVLGVAMFVLAPTVGWTSILLVVTAVVAAYTFEPPGVTLVVLVQTVGSAVAGALAGLDVLTVVLTVLAYGTFQAFAALLVVAARREAAARVELAVAHADLRAASVLLQETSRTAERLRISRDLHDTLGHRLTAIALELEIAGHRPDGGSSEHTVRARDLAKELLADVRRTVGELREAPPCLREALSDLVRDVSTPDVDLTVVDDRRITKEQFSTVVRCVQELLTNAMRHGGASRLLITVTSDSDGIRIEGGDDGSGVDDLVLGNGLTGMRERFDALGGRVDFSSRAGQGFHATGVLPS